jgi:hypothetical protein
MPPTTRMHTRYVRLTKGWYFPLLDDDDALGRACRWLRNNLTDPRTACLGFRPTTSRDRTTRSVGAWRGRDGTR